MDFSNKNNIIPEKPVIFDQTYKKNNNFYPNYKFVKDFKENNRS